jgi:hypothetical protein
MSSGFFRFLVVIWITSNGVMQKAGTSVNEVPVVTNRSGNNLDSVENSWLNKLLEFLV